MRDIYAQSIVALKKTLAKQYTNERYFTLPDELRQLVPVEGILYELAFSLSLSSSTVQLKTTGDLG